MAKKTDNSGKKRGTSRPAGTRTTEKESAKDDDTELRIGRSAVPPALNDPKRRKEWGLPQSDDEPGAYMIELNILHRGGLEEADRAFLERYIEVVTDKTRYPARATKTYYSCSMTVSEWRKLVKRDEMQGPQLRSIYRIWPDFPIQAHIDRSISTVKADAAVRSYAATGRGIVWAVIDSGIEGSHPHFGGHECDTYETLHHADVIDLHRDFSLPDLDADPKATEEERNALLAQHRAQALSDPFGHGTHVAGIIAGGLPEKEKLPPNVDFQVFERTYEISPDGQKLEKRVQRRPGTGTRPEHFRGVAPACRLISLRVLDASGKGRASQVMRALEYVREKLNRDAKLMRVHGVNLSVGYEFDAEMFACGQSPLCVEVDRLVQMGIVVVAAAGNTGYGTLPAVARVAKVGLSNTINDPGNAAMAITVGATHRDSPHTYGVSYFSSKGPTGDGRLKPDLVAPGERITSCAAGTKLADISAFLDGDGAAPAEGGAPASSGVTAPGGVTESAAGTAAKSAAAPKRVAAYLDDSGTSMAAPHVSGAIAAFLSIRREFIGKPMDVKRIFLESATSLGRERYFEGHGLVDLMRAIQSV